MSARRAAGAYKTKLGFIIHPIVFTDVGVGIAVPPVAKVASDTTPVELGAAVRASLESDQAPIPHPRQDQWKEVGDRFLSAAGFRSWRALENGALYCAVRASTETITFSPMANGGSKGPKKGFQPFGAPDLTVAVNASNEELGMVLLEAFTACR